MSPNKLIFGFNCVAKKKMDLLSTLCRKETPAPWLKNINPLKPELNPICYLLALLGAHYFLHVSRIRVKLLTLR